MITVIARRKVIRKTTRTTLKMKLYENQRRYQTIEKKERNGSDREWTIRGTIGYEKVKLPKKTHGTNKNEFRLYIPSSLEFYRRLDKVLLAETWNLELSRILKRLLTKHLVKILILIGFIMKKKMARSHPRITHRRNRNNIEINNRYSNYLNQSNEKNRKQ